MSSLSEEIQLLARLEIEFILDGSQLGDFAKAIEELFDFPMTVMISEYFIEGAVFGAELDSEATETDKDLFVFPLHEKMRHALNGSGLSQTDEKEAVELFERLFIQGVQWTSIHKETNKGDDLI